MIFFAEKIGQNEYYTITEEKTGFLFESNRTLTSLAKCKGKIKEICQQKDVEKIIEITVSKGYKSPLYKTM